MASAGARRVFPTFCAVEGIRTEDEANGVRNARLWARVLDVEHQAVIEQIREDHEADLRTGNGPSREKDPRSTVGEPDQRALGETAVSAGIVAPSFRFSDPS